MSDKPEENTTINATEETPVSNELQSAQEQADKFKNEYLYLRAEFENYKRNAIKERSDLVKYGTERLVRDFLEIMDNFERALQMNVTPENFQMFLQGVQMTATELRNMLSKHGVAEVKSEGVPFDPNAHEALSSEPTHDMAPGHILRTFKKAYKLHDKLIRPAQVVVAKKAE
jgi:molecular chaperone GrpE